MGKKIKRKSRKKIKKTENMFLRMNESEMQFKIEKNKSWKIWGIFVNFFRQIFENKIHRDKKEKVAQS